MGIKNDSCTCAMGTRNMGFQGSVTIDEMKNEALFERKRTVYCPVFGLFLFASTF